jgi:hypothetical protein
MPTRPPLFALALAFVATLASASARAETYAILPARGDAFPPVLAEIDRFARKALTQSGVDVQPQELTDQQLADLQRSGVVCDLSSDDCALRIGLAAGVDVVLSQTVSIAGSRLLLKASAVSTTNNVKPRHVYGELALGDDGKSVASAVMRAVGKTAPPTPVPVAVTITPANTLVVVDDHAAGVEDGRLWLTPGAHHVVLRAPAHKPLDVKLQVGDAALDSATWALPDASSSATASTDASSSALASPADGGAPIAFTPGLVLAGAGGATALIAGSVAVASEASLSGFMSPTDRDNTELIGRSALVVAAVGVVRGGRGRPGLLHV